MLKPTLLLLGTLTAAAVLAACGGSDESASDVAPTAATSSPSSDGGLCSYQPDGTDTDVTLPPSTPTRTGKVPVTISSSVGELKLTLDADAAPCTVNSFLSLAQQGFFDGTYCHRIGDPAAFPMLQCGDPTATDPEDLSQAGRGGPGYRFADELTGHETYTAGTLAMANAGADTNGSQFFMVFGDIGLSPDYTVFGSIDRATITTLRQVAAAGNDGTFGDGTGAPRKPVEFEKISVG